MLQTWQSSDKQTTYQLAELAAGNKMKHVTCHRICEAFHSVLVLDTLVLYIPVPCTFDQVVEVGWLKLWIRHQVNVAPCTVEHLSHTNSDTVYLLAC